MHTRSLHWLNKVGEVCERLVELLFAASIDGSPINRPIWWLDPEDAIALGVDDEFLLGDDILIAPVMEEGSIQRDIYFPRGEWQDPAHPDDKTISGPGWVWGYHASLFVIPYFIRI